MDSAKRRSSRLFGVHSSINWLSLQPRRQLRSSIRSSCGQLWLSIPGSSPPDWYFQTPDRHQLFLEILHNWANDPAFSPQVRAKTVGTIRWIEGLPDYATRISPLLAHRHWFTIEDILAVITSQGQATMWSEPETPLPNWKNWMVLEGSSEFGEQMASSYSELSVALLPNRFIGVLQSSHFRVHPTPNDGSSDLAQTTEVLACLLLRDYAQDPTDRGSDTSAVY